MAETCWTDCSLFCLDSDGESSFSRSPEKEKDKGNPLSAAAEAAARAAAIIRMKQQQLEKRPTGADQLLVKQEFGEFSIEICNIIHSKQVHLLPLEKRLNPRLPMRLANESGSLAGARRSRLCRECPLFFRRTLTRLNVKFICVSNFVFCSNSKGRCYGL